jgi:protein MAK16
VNEEVWKAVLDSEKGKGMFIVRHPCLVWPTYWLGKDKVLEELQDEESEEEFDSDEELDDEGWGDREFVSDASELEEELDEGTAWDLEDMGLEKIGEDSEEVRWSGYFSRFGTTFNQQGLGWRVDFRWRRLGGCQVFWQSKQ